MSTAAVADVLSNSEMEAYRRFSGLQPVRVPQNAAEGVPEPEEGLALIAIPEIAIFKDCLQVVGDLHHTLFFQPPHIIAHPIPQATPPQATALRICRMVLAHAERHVHRSSRQ